MKDMHVTHLSAQKRAGSRGPRYGGLALLRHRCSLAGVGGKLESARRRLGRRLRYLRSSVRGLTATQVARLLHDRFDYRIDSTTLTKIENGQSRPTIDLLFLLSELYEVDMNTLFDREPADARDSLRYVFHDAQLLEELRALPDLTGDENAARTLRRTVRTLNEALGEVLERRAHERGARRKRTG